MVGGMVKLLELEPFSFGATRRTRGDAEGKECVWSEMVGLLLLQALEPVHIKLLDFFEPAGERLAQHMVRETAVDFDVS